MSALTPLPTAPSTSDPSTFNARADALVAALAVLVTELNAIIGLTIPAGSAAAGTLTGDTVAANVLYSSLQKLGVQAQNLAMGGFKATGLAVGSAATDSATYGQVKPAFNNRLMNPAFELDRRNNGASAATADDVYCFDRWYVLTQTAAVNVSQLTDPENGYPYAIRLTQNQAAAQRMGIAQIIEGRNCKDLRGAAATFVPRVRISTSQAVRYAILEWTGTEDSVTSDVVNDWTSSDYGEGAAKFFVDTSITIAATGTLTPSAAAWTSLTALTATLSASLTNIIVVVWTEGTAAQNVTLDLDYAQFERGSVATDFERRPTTVEEDLCERYLPYFRTKSAEGNVASDMATGVTKTTNTDAVIWFQFRVRARARPTGVTISAAGDFSLESVGFGSSSGASAVVLNSNANPAGAAVLVSAAATSAAGDGAMMRLVGSVSTVALSYMYFTGCEL